MHSGDFDPPPVVLDGLDLDWEILYRDREETVTRRRITVHALHGERYPRYIRAFCMTRRAERTFDVYRIVEAYDTRTREEVPVTYRLLDWIDEQRNPEPAPAQISDLDFPLTIIGQGTYAETWDIAVTEAHIHYGHHGVRGRTTRRKDKHHRKWSGRKTIYDDMSAQVIDPETGEDLGPMKALVIKLFASAS